ncbi:MAG: cysteine desulfurase [Bacteroidetes bacterium]|nr:cysteine desulfurase [Bacteroidota bacterium]
MKRIYLDNAATTAMDPVVLDAMMPYLTEQFGNPSSIYFYGRKSRLAIENARKSVAKSLQVTPGEIFFTSGGTESDNMAIYSAVHDLGCRVIITSPIEHHAVLHAAERQVKDGFAQLKLVKVLPDGHIDLLHLEQLLKETDAKCLVTLMHANNEIGNLLDLHAVAGLCLTHGAIFHSDTVQTVGHYKLDLSHPGIHFATGAGHKFHGPKGIGILYISKEVQVRPMIEGGGQERNMRAGTENLYGVVGFAKALELAETRMEQDQQTIQELKSYLIARLRERGDVVFNGDVEGKSLYTVLNASFPRTAETEMLLMNLDLRGICVSGGSACSSGADLGSHVIRALGSHTDRVPVRFSFCRHNTKEELDQLLEALKACC